MNQRPSEQPRFYSIVIGFALAGVLILGLGFWVSRRPTPAQPSVMLLSPNRDTTFDRELDLHFETSIPLRLLPTGWGNGRYHLHALVDSVEVMAGAQDLQPTGANRFRWTLRGITRPARVQLIWALPNHGRLQTGASAVIRVSPR